MRTPRRRPARLRTLSAVGALALTGAALAGCGGSDSTATDGTSSTASADPSTSSSTESSSADSGDFASQSAQDILATAKTDTTSLKSLHVSGTVQENGKPLGIDLQLDDQGDCQGSISIGKGTAELLGTGGKYWFRPDAAFWREQAGKAASAVIAKVGDKYVENDQLSSVCDLDSFFSDAGDDVTDPTVVGTDTIDGQDVVQVKGTDKTGGTTTISILADSPHYLVQAEGQGSSSGTVKLDQFDEDFTVQAPKPSDVAKLTN